MQQSSLIKNSMQRIQQDRFLPLRQPQPLLSTPSTASTASSRAFSLHPRPKHSVPVHPSMPFIPSTPLSLLRNPQQLQQAVQLIQEPKDRAKVIAAEHILEAPGVIDQFYHHPLDGSPTADTLAIALRDPPNRRRKEQSTCFLYRQGQCQQIQQIQTKEEVISSLKFNQLNPLLAVGGEQGTVRLFDLSATVCARQFNVHGSRIGCLQNTGPACFLTGSKDSSIVLNDVRLKNPRALTVLCHRSEVCGLSILHHTVASSSNDGKINLWDLRKSQQFQTLRLFRGGVKAVQWCPWKVGLLVAGGGAKDPRIVFWNRNTDRIDRSLEAFSQVTALRLREGRRDLVTTHRNGYGLVWDLERGRHRLVLKGHRRRIVGLAEGKGGVLWTLGADCTVRGWCEGAEDEVSVGSGTTEIRV